MTIGAIEAGGTKFVCAVSDNALNISDQITIPTTTPAETFQHVFSFFDKYSLEAIGVGSFGPIDIKEDSKSYGFITTTPKEGWKNFDFVGTLKKRYQVPIAWTTDVNASAYGEFNKGEARRNKSYLYLTIGTGIGGGAVVNGDLLEGISHPEMGHILVRPHPNDDFKGSCPYHSNCLEGLASGPSIERRYQKKGAELSKDSKAWDIEAYYIAEALVSYSLILSPEKIILGGGVMKQEQLFPMIREKFLERINGYLTLPPMEEYIVPPLLNDTQGIIGCFQLAKEKI